MKVKPLNDRVLVRRMEAEEKVKGGIIIPDTAKEKPLEGKVIAVGAGKLDENGKRVAMEVKAGDRVLFAKYAGTDINIDGEDRVILREDDVLAAAWAGGVLRHRPRPSPLACPRSTAESFSSA